MAEGLYIDLWEQERVPIVSLIKKGGGSYTLNSDEFRRRGNRDRYSFALEIEDGVIPSKDGNAVARDLKAVLDKSPSFRKYATGKVVVIRLGQDFNLEISVI